MKATDLADLLRRASDEVAVCRRVVAQTRDQLIAAEIASDRVALGAPSAFAEGRPRVAIFND